MLSFKILIYFILYGTLSKVFAIYIFLADLIILMAQSKSLQFSTVNKPIHIIGDIWLVPCVANKHQNSYSPIPKPLDQSIKSDEFSKKLIWTKEEDEALVYLVLQNNPKAWNLIEDNAGKDGLIS